MTTTDRIVVIPEITVPASCRDAQTRALEILEELRPRLAELHQAAIEVRDVNDSILVALFPHIGATKDGCSTDEMFDLANSVTGWDEVWEAIAEVGDMFSTDLGGGMQTCGLDPHEIARGGERDFPNGTTATLTKEDGGKEPVTVVVEWGPRHPLAEGGYIVRDVQNPETTYICTHEDIRAGLESVPSD